jgi:hypothetical protein
VASAAPTLTIAPAPSSIAQLTWSSGTGDYNIVRADGACPIGTPTTPVGTVLATDPTNFTDGPGSGTFCYRVDDVGAGDSSNEAEITVDATPPSVAFDAASLARVKSVDATATDSSGIASVQLQEDVSVAPDPPLWVNRGPADTVAPYAILNPVGAGLPDGSHDLRFVAIDEAGNVASTTPRTLVIDTVTEPTSITSPAGGGFFNGTIDFAFTNADPAPVTTGVMASPHGANTFAPRTGLSITSQSAPMTATWATSPAFNGDWDVLLTSTDALGNPGATDVVRVFIDHAAPNAPAFGTNPANGAKLAGTISFTFTAPTDVGLSGIDRVQFETQAVGGLWMTRSTDMTAPFTTASWTSTLADDCVCKFRLEAFDKAGNSASSAERTNIRVDNGPPPAPTALTTKFYVNSAPVLSWTRSATDDVVGYRVRRDGVFDLNGGGLIADPTAVDTDLVTANLDDGLHYDGIHYYEVFANDGSNFSLPTARRTILLDRLAPTSPTAPRAVRRAGRSIVDFSWGPSSDPAPAGGGSPSQVAKYVVRRALGTVAPVTATAGTAACNVPVDASSCVDSTAAEGRTYRYAIFAVDAAGNGSLAAVPPAVVIPDMTGPGVPGAFVVKPKGLLIAMTWRLPTASDLSRIVIVRNARRAPRSIADGRVVFTGKAARASAKQLGGTTAWYRAFALDRAGNVSATAGVRIRQPAFRLFPASGSEVGGTVRLTWRKPKRATYFNVQLYLGSKRVTQAWPKSASFKIPRSRLNRGKTYTWYVWPGVGAKSVGRYGTLIGKSTFKYLG